MNRRTDQQLLHDYAERRSEAAFSELVRRHIDLVHSTALRLLKDPHLAEDVTQSVFTALAGSARLLSGRTVLAGWLHRTTRNLAAKTVRTEVRRRAREQEAVAMNETASQTNERDWEQVAPHLDAALGELAETDRDALLLRYFQRKPAREIAETLGLNEEAAQKRVTRALEKLRGIFAARGVALSTSALASLLGLQAVQTAPAALAASVSAASVTAGAASTFTLLSLMSSTKLKLGAAALVAAGLLTPVVIQQQQLKQLRAENAALIEQTRELESLRAEYERLSRQRTNNETTARDQTDRLELLRLRAEVTRLGNELRQRSALPARAPATNATASAPETVGPRPAAVYTGASSARVSDGGTFAMGGWQSAPEKRAFLLITPLLVDPAGNPLKPAGALNWDSPPQVRVATRLLEVPESELSPSILQTINDPTTQSAPVLPEDSPGLTMLLAMAKAPGPSGVNIVSTPSVTTLDGRQANVSVGQEIPIVGADGNVTNQFVGTAIDLLPRVATDGKSISVEASISYFPTEAAAIPGSEITPKLRSTGR